jgi:hypothetical protein|tara:strand:- start:10829 stop:11284 length:456 start_codon:yes stop_codon:yes gene_type:complete
MTKQQKTYGLLIAVLVIWGVIGYQIYIRLNPPTPEFETNQIQTRFQRKQAVKQSFYALNKEYRDPFLGRFPKKKTVRKKTIISKKLTTPFPNVQYNGIIEGNGHKSYILTVNRKQEIIKLGQVFQGIKLIKGTKNEILVKFENETKKIVKQ